MAEMSCYMRKLEKVAKDIGVHLDGDQGKAEDEEVDTSQMTKYEKNRYAVTKVMAGVREDLASLDDIERGKTSASASRKAELSNRVRKNLRTMKIDAANLKKDAAAEGKLDEYDELIKHMKRTERLNAERYRAKDRDDDLADGFDSCLAPVPMRNVRNIDQIGDQGDLQEGFVDPADDEEFQLFYQETKQRNQQIDEGLAVVGAGLVRLKQHALGMQDELQSQNRMLDDVNEQTENLTHQVQNMNQKLTQVLKDVEKDKYCCYLICCLLLLGVLGVIISQSGMLS